MPPCAAQLRDVDVENHGYKDGDTQDDVEGVGAYTLKCEAVAEDGEDQRPEERARNGTDPTQQRRPPYDRGGDAQEHDVRPAEERVYGQYAEGLDDAHETAKHAAEYEVADLDAGDADAGLPGPERVATRGVGVQPPPGAGED